MDSRVKARHRVPSCLPHGGALAGGEGHPQLSHVALHAPAVRCRDLGLRLSVPIDRARSPGLPLRPAMCPAWLPGQLGP